MRNRNETAIFFFDMKISFSSRKYDGLKPFDAAKVLSLIERVRKSENTIRQSISGQQATYMTQTSCGTDYGYMLISLSDKDAADPAFSNPTAKTRREVPKYKGEGLEVSSHIVIKLKPSAPDTYSVVIELANGLPSPRIERFINFMLRRAAALFPDEFDVDSPTGEKNRDGQPKKVKARAKISLSGHPSKQLIADINAGTLTALELLQATTSKIKWDEDGYVLEKSLAVGLDLSGIRSNKKVKHFAFIQQICNKAKKKNMDELRVRFKTAGGLHRTVIIDPTTQNTNDDAYIRKEQLEGFNNPLQMAYEKANDELVTRITMLLK